MCRKHCFRLLLVHRQTVCRCRTRVGAMRCVGRGGKARPAGTRTSTSSTRERVASKASVVEEGASRAVTLSEDAAAQLIQMAQQEPGDPSSKALSLKVKQGCGCAEMR